MMQAADLGQRDDLDLKARRQLARTKLDELKAAGNEKWESCTAGVEQAASDLDTALRRADKRPIRGMGLVWAVALITSFTSGGYIHLLLLPALVIVGMRLIHVRRAA